MDGQAGDGVAAGRGSPAIIAPFRGEGQVETCVDVGMRFEPFDESWHPGAGHHHADGSGGAFCEGGHGAFVGFEGHTGVVDVDDQDAATFWVTEAFGVGGVGGLRGGS